MSFVSEKEWKTFGKCMTALCGHSCYTLHSHMRFYVSGKPGVAMYDELGWIVYESLSLAYMKL